MACENPRRIRNPRYKGMSLTDMYDYSERHYGKYARPPDVYLDVGCGFCASCQKRRLNSYRMRLMYECEKYPNTLYLTLTFTDDALKEYKNDYNRAIKEFLDSFRKKFGKGVKHFFISEFGDDTHRIHYHGLLFNVPKTCTEFDVDSIWNRAYGKKRKDFKKFVGVFKNPRGIVDVSWLREGPKAASYICKYLTKDYDSPTEKRPRVLISNGVGLGYLSPVQVHLHRSTLSPFLAFNGRKYALPKYYKDKIFDQDLKDRIIINRMNEDPFAPKELNGRYHYPIFPGYYPTYEKALQSLHADNLRIGISKKEPKKGLKQPIEKPIKIDKKSIYFDEFGCVYSTFQIPFSFKNLFKNGKI